MPAYARWKITNQPFSYRTFNEYPTLERIIINPDICHGKPCIRGLRYPVETILEWLASDMSIEEILEDYPDLEKPTSWPH